MNKLFTSLFAAAKAANPEKKIATVQEETVRLWNQFKKEENFEQNVEKEITRLKGIVRCMPMELRSFSLCDDYT